MAEQWLIPSGVMPLSAVLIDEDGEEEYFIPGLGMFNEDQAAGITIPEQMAARQYGPGLPTVGRDKVVAY